MIVAFRLTRVGLRLGYGLATAALVYPLVGRPAQLKLKQRWSRQLVGMLGVRLQADAAPLPASALLVANHVSWLDIFVINALTPAAFVCKADVREWPLIGWLCERTETVFMPRGSRSAARQTSEIVAALSGRPRRAYGGAGLLRRDHAAAVAAPDRRAAAPGSPPRHPGAARRPRRGAARAGGACGNENQAGARPAASVRRRNGGARGQPCGGVTRQVGKTALKVLPTPGTDAISRLA